MPTADLPLSVVTAILARVFEQGDSRTIMRKVRHWTVTGLLTPAKTFTGTGKARHYDVYEVRKAAVLVELSRYGMTVGLSEGVAEWLDHFREENHPLLALAASGRCRIYIRLMGMTREIDFMGSVYVHDDDLAIANAAQPEACSIRIGPVSKVFIQYSPARPNFGEHPVFSALWIDLTQLLTKVESAYEQVSAILRAKP